MPRNTVLKLLSKLVGTLWITQRVSYKSTTLNIHEIQNQRGLNASKLWSSLR